MKPMKRGTIMVVLGVAVLIVAATVFIEITGIPRNTTNRVVCTDSISSNIEGSTVSTGIVVYNGTTAKTYTTTTNSTFAKGHTEATTTIEGLLDGQILTMRTCTFIG